MTDGRTDGRTNQPINEQTQRLLEMLSALLNASKKIAELPTLFYFVQKPKTVFFSLFVSTVLNLYVKLLVEAYEILTDRSRPKIFCPA